MYFTEQPDKWVILRITHEGTSIYKLLAGWYGGYLGSDEWRLSSGIISVVEEQYCYDFTNESGSVYRCYKNAEGMSSYTSSIYARWKQADSVVGIKIEIIESKNYVQQETKGEQP